VADLYVDGAVLDQVRDHLIHMRDLLEKPARKMGNVDAKVMGADDLVKRMADFDHEWQYGIGKLAQFSHDAAQALDQIKKTFEQADVNLAQALTNAAQKKGDAR
jgi:hypothetical protein